MIIVPTVHYPFEINYLYDQDGKLFPRLTFNVSVPATPSRTVVVDTYLDPGSERTVPIQRNLLGRDFFNLVQIGF